MEPDVGEREGEGIISIMGRKGAESEVEKRKEDKVVVKTAKKDDTTKTSSAGSEAGGESESWLESPRMIENMRYFVFAQSFVIFLTFGLPKLQQAWEFLMDQVFK